uniref:AAA+ ATPase domain-containing protein n=1 Tax=viral metagenome TaxID=1070528 RepID=A0A6C0ES80_9ZZZZ
MLPWIEKYRPNHLNDIILDEETKKLFTNMIDDKYFPQILFYGPPGTGKTTTIICLLKMYQAKYKCSHNVIHLNASDERGIETIRTQIHSFIYTQGMFHNDLKFIVLDEVDSMTKPAQLSLLGLLNIPNVRFCLICNYISKLIQPLRDALLLIPFYNTINDDTYINNIVEKEHIKIDNETLKDIKFNYYPDLRSTVNSLQNYYYNPYPIIKENILDLVCTSYNDTSYSNTSYNDTSYSNIIMINEYIKTIYFKDFLIKLFIKMLNYNVDIKLIKMMKDLIIIKQDFDYFDKYFMPYYKELNP